MIQSDEIRDGIVLRLDPDELEARGARCASEAAHRVQGPTFFLCVAADDVAGNWVPLFPDPGPRRDLLANEHKDGAAGWRSSETFFHTEQVWQAPHEAVVHAAIVGGDLSQPGQRNVVIHGGVDVVYESVFGE